MEYIFEDRALILQGKELVVLVATDIHIGYEIDVLERTGVSFPDLAKPMLKRFNHLIEKYHVNSLYLIGDIKHSIGVDREYNWREIPSFMEGLREHVDVTVVPGNHDGDLVALLPRDIQMGNVQGEVVAIGDHRVGLIHGHAWPSSDVLSCDAIVMGHNHPTVRRMKDVSAPQIGRAERRRPSHVIPVVLKMKLMRDCVRKSQGQLEMGDDDTTLIVLASFNDLLTGVYVNRPDAKLQGPFFENGCAELAHSEVYSISGIFLGTAELLRRQFMDSGQQRNH